MRIAGYGVSLRPYPDIYNCLAKPCQFDDRYNITPGMYHQTAAGLNSSVVDPAKFDTPRDQGSLLGDHAKTDMFTTAFSAYLNRRDLMCGLE
ncbi:MAG: hypothetical protein JSV42_11405 [Chloroflexota bacterium]|nr:MAG: hypothetical protein JSV42_11405 [Chloroflexota bacterium]